PENPSMCAASSKRLGRIRLPPPSRRYSAISVMVLTLDAASRPNSCSIATRSSRSRSKTSLAVDIASVLKSFRFPRVSGSGLQGSCRGSVMLIRPVVRKQQVDSQIFPAKQRDDRLQVVAVFPGYSHTIALNAGLDLLF